MGGSAWLQQFIYGFQLVGNLSQGHTFPISDKVRGPKPKPLSEILQTNSRRFTGRAQKSGFKNAKLLWAEAMEQRQKGWLASPSLLTSRGDPFALLGKS